MQPVKLYRTKGIMVVQVTELYTIPRMEKERKKGEKRKKREKERKRGERFSIQVTVLLNTEHYFDYH